MALQDVRAMNWSSPILNDPPAILTRSELDAVSNPSESFKKMVPVLEALIKKYGDLPYLLARCGQLFAEAESKSTAIALYRRAAIALSRIGKEDQKLNEWVQREDIELDRAARDILVRSQKLVFGQFWKATTQHNFPLNQPILPSQHDEIRQTWTGYYAQGLKTLQRYIDGLIIETHHVENTFQITVASTRDLIRYGIVSGIVKPEPKRDSLIKDPATIQSIIRDTLDAYELLHPVVEDPAKLTPTFIKEVHATLMRTSRFSGRSYVPPGETRSSTKETVHITGAYSIQCCPYDQVDKELEYICRMARQYIMNWRNPFATASWLHLILARCHPFNDGNGRTTRLIASIPLLKHNYPPISIMADQRELYYMAINQAFNGNHGPFIESIVSGMQRTLQVVRDLP